MTAEFATRARACVLRGGLRGGPHGRGRQNVRTWRIIIECLAIALEFDELLPEFNGVYCPRDSECLCLGPAQEACPTMELQRAAIQFGPNLGAGPTCQFLPEGVLIRQPSGDVLRRESVERMWKLSLNA